LISLANPSEQDFYQIVALEVYLHDGDVKGVAHFVLMQAYGMQWEEMECSCDVVHQMKNEILKMEDTE
jgi:hypothetical protein